MNDVQRAIDDQYKDVIDNELPDELNERVTVLRRGT